MKSNDDDPEKLEFQTDGQPVSQRVTGSKGSRRDRWLAGLEPWNTVGRFLDDAMPPRSRCGQSLRLKVGSGLLGRHTGSRTMQPTGGP